MNPYKNAPLHFWLYCISVLAPLSSPLIFFYAREGIFVGIFPRLETPWDTFAIFAPWLGQQWKRKWKRQWRDHFHWFTSSFEVHNRPLEILSDFQFIILDKQEGNSVELLLHKFSTSVENKNISLLYCNLLGNRVKIWIFIHIRKLVSRLIFEHNGFWK